MGIKAHSSQSHSYFNLIPSVELQLIELNFCPMTKVLFFDFAKFINYRIKIILLKNYSA